MSVKRVLPEPHVSAQYGPIGGKYPERIKVTMADGESRWYQLEVPQPKPVMKDWLDRFDGLCGKEKTGGCGNSQPVSRRMRYRANFSTEREEK